MKQMRLLLLLLTLFTAVTGSPVQQHVDCDHNPRDHFSPNAKSVALDSGCERVRKNAHAPAGRYSPAFDSVDPHHPAASVVVTPRHDPPNLLTHLALTEVGCYRDFAGAFDAYTNGTTESIASCASFARAHGYQYIGLGRRGSCGASNTFHVLSDKRGEAVTCDYQCTSDPGNICGGHFANSVFHVNDLPHVRATLTNTTLPTPYWHFNATNWAKNPAGVSNIMYFMDALYNETLVIANDPSHTNSYVTLTPGVSLTQSYTKTAWVFPIENMNSAANMMSSLSTSAPGQHYFYFSNGVVTAGHAVSGVTNFVSAPYAAPIRNWTHVAVTYNHTSLTMRLFINGTMVSTAVTTAQSAWTGGSAMALGTYGGSCCYFNGKLAQASLFDHELTVNEVQALYLLPFPAGTPPPPTGIPPPTPPPAPKVPVQDGIQYHGGAIMAGQVNAYLIWYGDFSGTNTTAVVTNAVTNLGGTPYWNILTTYWQNITGKITWMSNSLKYAGSAADPNYSYNKTLSDSAIYYIVRGFINSKVLPQDNNGIYLVITAKDVIMSSGFCTSYCGWHSAASLNSQILRYGTVGDATTQCMRSCTAQSSNSPNGNPAADGIVSVVAHELGEAASDPVLSSWTDTNGYENMDKCAWTFGTQYTTPNGARANMKLGANDYLIQQNWVNSLNPATNSTSGYCALSWTW